IGRLRTSSHGSLYTAVGDQPVFWLAAILLLVGFVRLARVGRHPTADWHLPDYNAIYNKRN
ncbi:MAG: hypothetical protein V3T83_09945, partial [Acidobacteriota bacterium]